MTAASLSAATPKVSVVMPAFNAAQTVAASIKSVMAQIEPSWELLVVDDGSTDDTSNVVERYADQDARIRLLRTSGRQGAAAARNVALATASGRWIAFLDSDDLWAPEKLTRQLAFMEKRGAAISFTSYQRIDADGQLRSRPVRIPAEVTYRELLKSNCIGCLTAMYDRECFPQARMPDLGDVRRYGPVWTTLLGAGRIGHEDFAFWLQLLKPKEKSTHLSTRAYGLPEPLAFYRIGTRSLSSNKLRAAMFQWLIYRAHQRLSWPESLYLFMHYAWRGLMKHADA